MLFKENLIKKIEIKKITSNVIASIKPPGSDRKINKKQMQRLLNFSPYSYTKKRNMDIYVKNVSDDKKNILVLDNDLNIYHTTLQDVVLRKNPTVKEIINIRNIIKILNDRDVIVSKREESVKTIQNEAIGQLDLSFTKEDIESIAKESVKALENSDVKSVIDYITMFSEILEYVPISNDTEIGNDTVIMTLPELIQDTKNFRSTIIYNTTCNRLRLIENSIKNFEKKTMEKINRISKGEEKAVLEGAAVFEHLKKEAIKTM